MTGVQKDVNRDKFMRLTEFIVIMLNCLVHLIYLEMWAAAQLQVYKQEVLRI